MARTGAYNVRQATEDDILDIAYIGKKFVKESQNTHLGWSQDKVIQTLQEVIHRDDFLNLVLEKDEEIVGFFTAFATPSFFSDKLQAVELAWYVLPDHRKSRQSLKMLDEYEKWAKERGITQINMINLDVLNRDKVAKTYEKKGYKMTENTFSKELM